MLYVHKIETEKELPGKLKESYIFQVHLVHRCGAQRACSANPPLARFYLWGLYLV